MNALKILLVEDNFITAQNTIEQLSEFGYSDVVHASNGEEAKQVINSTKPQLAILDISLNSKMSGIDVAEYINQREKIPIIFLTALSDSKTTKLASAVNPSNYLIKPYQAKQLDVAIDMALSNFANGITAVPSFENPNATLKDILFLLDDSSFFIKHKQRYVRVLVPDILWVKAEGSSVEIVTKIGRYIICANLGSFMKQVAHKSLIRVHRSYAININAVDAFNEAFLIFNHRNAEKKIPFGRSYKQNVVSLFRQVKAD